MRYAVTGTMQTVSINLASGESLDSQNASTTWMSPSIWMDTRTGGGIFGSIVGDN